MSRAPFTDDQVPQENQVLACDGAMRSRAEDMRISKLMARFFAQEGGEHVLTYLRNITINRVLPANCSTEELRDVNGMCRLYQIIATRIQEGEEGKHWRDHDEET